VVKAPGTKRNPPSLLIELNPVDENNLPTKRRGLYIRTRKDLEEYRKLINDSLPTMTVGALISPGPPILPPPLPSFR
jgi:hypothetical protein